MSQAVNKITAERNQRALLELVNQPGNDVCADCKARNPRWASHNLGIFICVNCASIHRKIGTHITKVKSLTLDSWTKEQVEHMKQNGNVKSNAHYNADERRHPPPTNMIESERDSELEKYIRAKYEFKSFLDKRSKVAALLGPSQSAASRQSAAPPTRSQTVPIPETKLPPASVPPPVPEKLAAPAPAPASVPSATFSQSPGSATPASSGSLAQAQPRSVSQPALMASSLPPQQQIPTSQTGATIQPSYINATLPLQYAQPSAFSATAVSQPISIPNTTMGSHLSVNNPYSGLSVSPGSPLPSSSPGQMPSSGVSPGAMGRSMSLNTGMSLGVNSNFAGGMGTSPGQLSTSPFASQLMQNPTGFSAQPMLTPGSNPFAPGGGLSGAQSMGMGGLQQQNSQSGFNASAFQPQQQNSQSGYNTSAFQPQQQVSQLYAQPQMQPQPSPSPLFQPQLPGHSPVPPQMQLPGPGNPFMQQQQQQQMQPQYTAQAQFTGAPGQFGQPQQQQAFHSSNPFGGWQQGQQGHAPQQFQPQQFQSQQFQPQQSQPQQFQPQQFQPQQTGFQGQQWNGF